MIGGLPRLLGSPGSLWMGPCPLRQCQCGNGRRLPPVTATGDPW